MATAARRPATALNDMELAELASVGDRAALGELARRHGPAVRALLQRTGVGAALADALARQAFLSAFERMAEFRGQGAFPGWIRRLAFRHYLARGSIAVDPRKREPPTPSDGGGVDGLAQEVDRDIDAAMSELTPSERLHVCSCCGAGLTAGEVADATSSSVEDVRASLHRGLDSLRLSLGSSGTDETPSEFERRLERALAAVDHPIEGLAFAQAVERRLAQSWWARRLAIAVAATGSALFALWRVGNSSLATRLEATIRSPFALLVRRFGVLNLPLLRLLPGSGDALWLLGGLVLLAAGLIATRMFDEP